MAPDLLDTLSRARHAYASVSELRREQAPASENATSAVSEEGQPADVCAVQGFERSAQRFWELAGWLAGGQARDLEHSQLEARLAEDGRELLRALLQDHFDLREVCERRVDGVLGADGVPRAHVERAHERELLSVFGGVEVGRLAYRARGCENLYPADAQLNLPAEKHSHGMRRLAALEAPRTSFEDAQAAIVRQTGQRLGKRQLRELAVLAAGLLCRGCSLGSRRGRGLTEGVGKPGLLGAGRRSGGPLNRAVHHLAHPLEPPPGPAQVPLAPAQRMASAGVG